jgi:N-acyl-D-amino-acid deacylase
LRRRRLLVLVLALAGASAPGHAAPPAILFEDALVADGTGNPLWRGDVRVEGGRIAAVAVRVGRRRGDRVVSARGRVIAPGFIDLHNHLDRQILDMPDAATQTAQGITTALVGLDGGSPPSIGEFLGRLDAQSPALDVAALVGHGTVRTAVMGEDYKRTARPDEVARMAALVARGMDEGAFGLSSGLEYDPGYYASTDELVALAREAAVRGGLYVTHLRNEADRVLEALREAVEIGRRAGLPVQVSHLKMGSAAVWGRAADALQVLREGRRRVDVTADWYPYDFWSSTTYVLMPGGRAWDDRAAWAQGLADVGGAGRVLITEFAPDRSLEGHTLAEAARTRGRDPADLLMDIVARGGAGILCTAMEERDLAAFLRDPLVMVASDGGIRVAHPRGAGTFPRVLGRYVREGKVIPLETAIYKMTGMPARRIGLRDRGALKPGLRADVVLFDPSAVADRSTAQRPQDPPAGIEWVLVDGVPVVEAGRRTGARPGRALRRGDTRVSGSLR